MSIVKDAPLEVPTKKRWTNLGTRVISALVLIAIALAPLYIGGWFWAGLAAMFGIRIIYEWVRMSDGKDVWIAFLLPMAGCVTALVWAKLGNWPLAWTVTASTITLCWIERMRRKGGKGGSLWAGLGAAYMLVPTLCLVWLRNGGQGFDAPGLQIILFIMIIVIVADTFAYIGGSIMGGPKMAPKISPKKTWSGFLTGFGMSIIVGVFAAIVLHFDIWKGVVLGGGVAALSVIGDLLESWCKRKLGVKDTGELLPGHGGLLDRFDSLMMAATVAALALYFVPELWPVVRV